MPDVPAAELAAIALANSCPKLVRLPQFLSDPVPLPVLVDVVLSAVLVPPDWVVDGVTVTVTGGGALDFLLPPQPATANTAATSRTTPAAFRKAIFPMEPCLLEPSLMPSKVVPTRA
jgi:hypothetical protein